MDSLSNEDWRAIPGYEDSYEVSSCGRVRSLTRRIPFKNGTRTLKGQIKRPATRALGYQQVLLSHDRKRQWCAVHRLVLLAFVGPSDLEVHHVDFDPSNNHLSNLRYVSHEENIQHTVRAGRAHEGTKHHQARLRPCQVLVIYGLRDRVPQARLARRYGVSQAAVHWIQSGRNWKSVTRRATPA